MRMRTYIVKIIFKRKQVDSDQLDSISNFALFNTTLLIISEVLENKILN